MLISLQVGNLELKNKKHLKTSDTLFFTVFFVRFRGIDVHLIPVRRDVYLELQRSGKS